MNFSQAIKVLKLDSFTGPDDLKRCFRDRVHESHPDKNPHADVNEFHQILEAYRYLAQNLDDLYNHFELQDEPTVTERSTITESLDELDDIFDDIFGFSKAGRVFGYHHPQSLVLTLKELALGATLQRKMEAYVSCMTCSGQGTAKGGRGRICSYCFGRGCLGAVEKNKKIRGCPQCRGRGRIVSPMCPVCDGFGRLKRVHKQEVKIPRGLKLDEPYTLAGFDHDLKRETELYVIPVLGESMGFQVDQWDLLWECSVRSDQSKESEILKTPWGPVTIPIPRPLDDQQKVCFKGLGLFRGPGAERGDLVVTFKQRSPSWFERYFGGWFE